MMKMSKAREARFGSKRSGRFRSQPSIWKNIATAVGSLHLEEWINLLLRSIGLEPCHFGRRLAAVAQQTPAAVRTNYNLVELGPRGTGKSYAYQELSPYTILLTGPTTVANLFYNMATNKMGLVGIWDAIAFDEVADLQKMPKEVITTLKTLW